MLSAIHSMSLNSLNTYYVPTSDPGSKVISKSMKDDTATQLYFKSN